MMRRMATAHPLLDPLDEEIERVLAENPGLLEELQEWDRRFATGEVSEDEFISTEEVRRRLGLPPYPG
jgi:hypothetical protein